MLINRNKIIFGVFLLGVLSFSCLYFYSFYSLKNPANSSQEYVPKPSAGEINIISPQNKTYAQPDYGYYPATYGFESDFNGNPPKGWNIREVPGGSVTVINSIDNHRKVLDLYDGTASEYVLINTNINPQTSGTIEFYMRVSDASQQHNFRVINYAGGHLLRFGIGQGQFEYNDGTWHNVGKPAYPNTWYHISIHFECTLGDYLGLNQYNWRVQINGVAYGDYGFFSNQPFTDYLDFHIVEPSIGHLYLDAIGYSWDSNYKVGNNLNEGLLLSFENTTNLNRETYSLDGGNNQTIFGDTVIPFPTDGQHQIQVFGNDTFGDLYKSNLRFFSIDSTLPYISILGPPQNSYFSSSAPTFHLSISGVNLSRTYYRIGDSEFSFDTSQGYINQALWDSCAEGSVLITFYANNILGNYAMAEISVYKDTILPFISTQFSYEDKVYDEPPYFFLTISDTNLDLKWFTLNDDPTRHYLPNQNLGFGSKLWSSLGDGLITITVHATDKAGNENSYVFHVIKNFYNPVQHYPNFYPSYIAIAIGGILLLGIVVAIVVIYTNKNSQPRPYRINQDQISYHSPPARSKEPKYSVTKRIKCPYCSCEEDIDGNFCPQCGARLK